MITHKVALPTLWTTNIHLNPLMVAKDPASQLYQFKQLGLDLNVQDKESLGQLEDPSHEVSEAKFNYLQEV